VLSEELVDRIVNSAQIPRGKRPEIQRELRAHIEDFVEAAHAAGHDQDEIAQLLLANFGEPGQIAEGFAWVYRHERRTLRITAYAVSTVLLASSLLVAILTMQAGLAFGFGKPIIKVLASRHTIIEALDVLMSVAAYLGLTLFEKLFESHGFQKAAVLLTAIVSILAVSCAAAGLHTTVLLFGLINGIFFRAVQLFITRKVVRVAIAVVCFPLAGLVLAFLRPPVSQVAPATTCASWLVMGVGYQLMTDLAVSVDAALLNGLQQIQARY
jgi:hypothetical protein